MFDNITRKTAIEALIMIGGRIEGIELLDCSEPEQKVFYILKSLRILETNENNELCLTKEARTFRN